MRHTDPADWATFVRQARLKAGISQETMAARLGINRQSVIRWERGKYKPDSRAVVYSVAQVLGADHEAALLAAGFDPADGPDPRLLGLDPDDRSVKAILAAGFPAAMEDRMLAMIKERRTAARREELDEIERTKEMWREARGA